MQIDNCKYLVDEDPIYFLPTLAVGIGLNEAILLQKLHGWLKCTPKEHIGRNWIYNSYKSWHEQLPFMSETAIKRATKNLIDKGIIITENFNKNSFDKTLWYSIDYEKLTSVVQSAENVETIDSVKSDYRLGQIGLSIVSNRTNNTNNNDNNIKESNNINIITKESFEKVWEMYPKKRGKDAAFKDFAKSIKGGESVEKIKQGLENYIKYIELEKVEQKYIMNGSTWFHQHCWNDDYTVRRQYTTKDIASRMDFSDVL